MVVGTSRVGLVLDDVLNSGFDTYHPVGRSTSHPNLIQVWKIDTGSKRSANVIYFIGLIASGPVWSLAWSPDSCSESHLGRAAVVCGDGLCRIIDFPSSSAVPVELHGNHFPNDLPLFEEQSVCRCTLKMPALPGSAEIVQITCADWVTLDRVVCGTSGGHVALFTLLPVVNSCLPPNSISYDLSDYTPNLPSAVCIRSITVCPFARELVASAGNDGFVKFWDIRLLPVTKPLYKFYSRNGPQVGWLYDVRTSLL